MVDCTLQLFFQCPKEQSEKLLAELVEKIIPVARSMCPGTGTVQIGRSVSESKIFIEAPASVPSGQPT